MQIGEVASFQNGYAFKSKDFVQDGKYKIIKIKELKDGKVRFFNDSASVNVDDERIIEKYIVEKGDVLFALTGDPVNKNNPLSWVGRVSVYEDDQLAVLNQRVCKLVPKEGLNAKYIYYYFRAFNNFYALASIAKGSASQANISTKDIEAMEIALPSLNIQNKIVSVLDSIEEKINQNNKINKNLADQAQAIYQQYFVAEANPDWPLGHLSDLIDIKYGKDHKKLADGTYPVYGSGGIMRYVERPLYEKESVLIPRKGTLNNVIYVNQPFWSVDTMFYTEMKQDNVAKFVYHYVKSKDLASMNAGSAVPSMTTAILNALELPLPSIEALKHFEVSVAPMYKMMQKNEEESHKLAKLRDALLPKLMSGEIDVSALSL